MAVAPRFRAVLGCLLLASFVPVTIAGAQPPVGAMAETADPAAAPGRIIVKYAPGSAGSPSRQLSRGLGMQAVTGTPSLDSIHERLGVKGARRLFGADAGSKEEDRRTQWQGRVAATRQLFDQRTARAPFAAQVPDLSNVYVVEFDEGVDVEDAAASYAADPSVLWAEPDYRVSTTLVPNDPFYGTSDSWGQGHLDLYGVHVSQAASAWDVSTGQGVVIAIVDTGVDRGHPDLAANMWANPGEIASNGVDDDGNGFIDDVYGWDFTDNDNNPDDRHGHGTHVAGTAAAAGNNSTGVVGMAYGAQIMNVKGLDHTGSGFTSDLAEAIVYAAENGADVINNSWGGPFITQVVIDAVETARALGSVVVAAAGNDSKSADDDEPSGIDGVITVAATTFDGSLAWFTNFGETVNVAAPGLDILSLRGDHSANVGGTPVAGDYLVLSGTSMASPHVAGLAALLLEADPSLTVDEVAWHLELNADQPEYPGYEGEPFNPFYGWGRINAANVFNAPPVTTRVSGSIHKVHAFEDSLIPTIGALDVEFTTAAPVPWTATTSTGLGAAPASGSGPAEIGLSMDTTGLSIGDHPAVLTINAPSAVDGGTSKTSSVYVHRDERTRSPVIVDDIASPKSGSLAMATNSTGTLIAWAESGGVSDPRSISAVLVDNAGNVTAPFEVFFAGENKGAPYVASDGNGYLVVWNEIDGYLDINETKDQDNDFVYAVRVGPDGTLVDDVPIEVGRQRDRDSRWFRPVGVSFVDGVYVIMYADTNIASSPDRTRIYIRRLQPEGTFTDKARRIWNGFSIGEAIACLPGGSCLLSWSGFGGVRPSGIFNWSLYTLKIVGDERAHEDLRQQVELVHDVRQLIPSADGSGYMAVGGRIAVCGEGEDEEFCRRDALAMRLDEDGNPLDADAIVLNQNSPFELSTYRSGGGGAADGDGWLAAYVHGAVVGEQWRNNVFVSRIDANGDVVDGEDEGLLALSAAATSMGPPLVSKDAKHSVVAWMDSETSPAIEGGRVNVVTMLPTALPSQYVQVDLGSVGAVNLSEGQTVKMAVGAPGLDPATTTFAATGLPEGAFLEAATGLFTWRPNGSQSGTYEVELSADDGASSVAETVDFDVAEATLTVGGTATYQGSGLPAAGMAFRLKGKGAPFKRMTAFSDAQGRFRFEGVTPGGRYKIKLDKPSKKRFRSDPRSIKLDLGPVDNVAPGFLVTAK